MRTGREIPGRHLMYGGYPRNGTVRLLRRLPSENAPVPLPFRGVEIRAITGFRFPTFTWIRNDNCTNSLKNGRKWCWNFHEKPRFSVVKPMTGSHVANSRFWTADNPLR